MMEGVEHRDQVHRRLGTEALEICDREVCVLQAEPLRVMASPLDRDGAVIESAERDVRVTARELAGDFAGTAPEVEDGPDADQALGGQVGKPPDGEIARVGRGERIVVLRPEDPVVEFAVARRRPSRESPAQLARRARESFPEAAKSGRQARGCGHPNQRAGFRYGGGDVSTGEILASVAPCHIEGTPRMKVIRPSTGARTSPVRRPT